jgi:cell division protein FtsZ
MVHRIQNRNPGYSDFGSTGSAQSFNFSQTMNSPISHGANALKLENEVLVEPKANNVSSEMMNEQSMSTQEAQKESIVNDGLTNDIEQSFTEETLNNMNDIDEKTSQVMQEHTSNGLENFGVEDESDLDLFSSGSETEETKELLSTQDNEDEYEDGDLEIPAFLRRQKN